MALTFKEITNLPKDKLEQEYNRQAKTTGASLNYYWYEILRREQNKQTKWIIGLTIVICITGVIAAIGVFIH